jgi:hypothetical protein
MQSPLPGQIILLTDTVRTLLRKALDEDSLEKVRDLLLDIGHLLANNEKGGRGQRK